MAPAQGTALPHLRGTTPGAREASGYSWAGICCSDSYQALIFRRRHTQHRCSAEFDAHSAPHTTHFAAGGNLSGCASRLALARISLEITGSVAGILFLRIRSSPLSLPHYRTGRRQRETSARFRPQPHILRRMPPPGKRNNGDIFAPASPASAFRPQPLVSQQRACKSGSTPNPWPVAGWASKWSVPASSFASSAHTDAGHPRQDVTNRKSRFRPGRYRTVLLVPGPAIPQPAFPDAPTPEPPSVFDRSPPSAPPSRKPLRLSLHRKPQSQEEDEVATALLNSASTPFPACATLTPHPRRGVAGDQHRDLSVDSRSHNGYNRTYHGFVHPSA